MDLIHRQLKEAIDHFLHNVNALVGKEPTDEEYIQLAESIFSLYHFAQQLLNTHPDESTGYNAQIIMDTLSDELSVSDRPENTFSLLDASEAAKQQQFALLASVLTAWKQDMALYDVFFEDFALISHELAA